jgi:hypothetical protein
MESFPELKGAEIVLMRANTRTGHVLDDQFELATKDNQTVFTLFNDIETALSFAKSIVSQHKTIECVIYGKDKEVLHYITQQVRCSQPVPLSHLAGIESW